VVGPCGAPPSPAAPGRPAPGPRAAWPAAARLRRDQLAVLDGVSRADAVGVLSIPGVVVPAGQPRAGGNPRGIPPARHVPRPGRRGGLEHDPVSTQADGRLAPRAPRPCPT